MLRAFLGRIVGNAGSSLTAGGTVLAIGLGVASVGVSASTKTSPWSNPWFDIGFILAMIGAAWVIGTFVLAMISTAKTERFEELIGHALNDGEALEDEGATQSTIRKWAQQTHDLIQAGLGPAEARLFLGESDLGTQFVSDKTRPGHPWLQRRLRRLSRLMDRMHSMHVGPVRSSQTGSISRARPRFPPRPRREPPHSQPLPGSARRVWAPLARERPRRQHRSGQRVSDSRARGSPRR